jgi:pyruvate/2-oxoglutarate/acetoin dehydrogenase E1 component
MNNRTRGKFKVPMVIRFPYGGGINAVEHHQGPHLRSHLSCRYKYPYP